MEWSKPIYFLPQFFVLFNIDFHTHLTWPHIDCQLRDISTCLLNWHWLAIGLHKLRQALVRYLVLSRSLQLHLIDKQIFLNVTYRWGSIWYKWFNVVNKGFNNHYWDKDTRIINRACHPNGHHWDWYPGELFWRATWLGYQVRIYGMAKQLHTYRTMGYHWLSAL